MPPDLSCFPELSLTITLSHKLVPPTLTVEKLFTVAFAQASQVNGHLRVCDKNMGLCLVNDIWYRAAFNLLVDKCYVRCDALSFHDIFSSSASFLQRLLCRIMYAKTCSTIANATPVQLKPAWNLYLK